jgi:hypothetical protein
LISHDGVKLTHQARNHQDQFGRRERLQQIEPWHGPSVLRHRMIAAVVGERTTEDALKNYAQHRET